MDVADERDREVDDPLQEAAGIHQFSGEQEERHRQELEVVGALDELDTFPESECRNYLGNCGYEFT
jgi:hypothetical protein